MSSVNLLLRRQGGAQAEDPATRLLTVLLLNLRVPVDVSYWATWEEDRDEMGGGGGDVGGVGPFCCW